MQLDDRVVKQGLKVSQLRRRRENAVAVYKLVQSIFCMMFQLKKIALVRQTQPMIQQLLSNSNYSGALDLIYRTQEVIATELAGVQSFKYNPFS